MGCSIGEFPRMAGVSFVITFGNRAAAGFDVKDCPEIKPTVTSGCAPSKIQSRRLGLEAQK
jgi:hypothetical protein